MSDTTQILQLPGAQLESIEQTGDSVTLHFSLVHLVQEMEGAIQDSLWTQAVNLTIRGIHVSGDLPDCPCEIGSGDLVWESIAGEPVLRFRREGSTSTAVVAINYATTQQQVSVATSLASVTFTAVLGSSDKRTADGSGSLTVDVPPRSAVVYVGQP